jgi:hypothetical protein
MVCFVTEAFDPRAWGGERQGCRSVEQATRRAEIRQHAAFRVTWAGSRPARFARQSWCRVELFTENDSATARAAASAIRRSVNQTAQCEYLRYAGGKDPGWSFDPCRRTWMPTLHEGRTRISQADQWLGAPIAALLEAIRRARSGRFRNASLSTRDLLHTLIRRFDNKHPTVDGLPVTDLPAFAKRFAERRLIDHHRRKQQCDRHAQRGRLLLPQAETVFEQVQEEAAAVTAIDWFLTALDRLERGELPSEIVVPTREGPARLRLQNPVKVAKTLRGLFIEGRDGCEIAVMLEVSEGQVSKYKTAGLRYIQILAGEELS